MRIFFTTDIHGSETCFMKFLNAAKAYKANVIILGGDITGKMIIPIVPKDESTVVVYGGDMFGTIEVQVKSTQLDQMRRKITDSGYYPHNVSKEDYEKLRSDRKLLDDLFSELMRLQVRRWNRIAEERLRGSGVTCYISPGNDDRFIIDLELGGASVINPEDKVVDVCNYEMITSGFCTPTPWKTTRECGEEELARKIARMESQVKNMQKCVFNLHCPPADSNLDKAPLLDKDLRPVVKGGGIVMTSAGSQAIRESIERNQPLLSLHGHVHEGKGVAKIGRTLCVNPGSEYGEGILRGAVVNLEGQKVKSYMFTSG